MRTLVPARTVADASAPIEHPVQQQMQTPAPRISKAVTEVGRSIRTAMKLLHEAFVYSLDVELSKWDFAVEIERLRGAGVTNSDLRWLVCKGYVEHADEITLPSQEGRSFRPNGNLALSDATCFVPTDDGMHFAKQMGVIKDGRNRTAQSAIPGVVWDSARRELCLDGKVVKRFRVPAPIQELILSVFHEEGWPVRIDDPLPPAAEIDAKQRLHAAINSLNRNQKNRLIRFRGDGKGNGVCWEIAKQRSSGAK